LRRRNFLVRFCQGAGATLIPAKLWGLSFPGFSGGTSVASSEYHLQPHYRSERPLDATLLKVEAGLDNFITEKYADQIATTLAEWNASLLQSPRETQAIAKVLTADFSGTALSPTDSRVVRSNPALEVRQNKFARQDTLGRERFLREWQSRSQGLRRMPGRLHLRKCLTDYGLAFVMRL
jgi:hypothetical protein